MSVGPPGLGDRRPLSIVVFGNSVAAMVLPGTGDRARSPAAATYLELLADRLAAVGIPVQPHLEARWFGFLHREIRDYESRVRNHCPDVLIVQFGLNEMQPWIVPVWLVRHLLVRGWAVTRTARGYRKYLADPAWDRVRALRQRVSPHVGMATWQTTPRRFAGHLRVLVRMVRAQSRPLVLVLDVNAPGPRLEHFLPGLGQRHAVFQRALSEVVAEFATPDVRLVPSAQICATVGPDALPDGMHMSAEAHRALADHLTGEILSWLSSRGR